MLEGWEIPIKIEARGTAVVIRKEDKERAAPLSPPEDGAPIQLKEGEDGAALPQS